MIVNGGKISFSRTVQPQQYESKKAEVELGFSIEDGDDLEKEIQAIKDIVIRQCLDMVGLRKKKDD